MLRTISLLLAAAAILVAIPLSGADARSRGHFSGGVRMGGGGIHHIHRGAFIHRGGFVRRGHFVHFRHRPFFVAGFYGTPCWRWVPTPFGFRRVWVCDPYYPYY